MGTELLRPNSFKLCSLHWPQHPASQLGLVLGLPSHVLRKGGRVTATPFDREKSLAFSSETPSSRARQLSINVALLVGCLGGA